jgi:hypothetical protein
MSNETNKIAANQPDVASAYQKAHEESWKLRYDTYKHLTTLATGSILLLVTFLEKLFTRPLWKGLVIAAFCLFFLTIMASFFLMNMLVSFIREGEVGKRDEKLNLALTRVALISFLLGVVSLIIFAVNNLLT